MDDSGGDEDNEEAAAGVDVASAAAAFDFFWDATRLATIDANGEVIDGAVAAVVQGAE